MVNHKILKSAAEEKERKEQKIIHSLSKEIGTHVETAQTLMAMQVNRRLGFDAQRAGVCGNLT